MGLAKTGGVVTYDLYFGMPLDIVDHDQHHVFRKSGEMLTLPDRFERTCDICKGTL